jgi:adenylate kinase
MPNLANAVLLIGPPGAGKGTQGRVIGSIPGFYHCACGDVFRRLNPDSEIGQTFLEYSSQGKLVPDDVTVEFWAQHINAQKILGAYKPASDLLALDGIPRNLAQAKQITAYVRVMKVVELCCPDEQMMIERLRRRALKENRLEDAKEDVIRHRWEVYRAETAPVLSYYPSELQARINAQQSPAQVLHDILEVIIPVQNTLYAKTVQHV